MRELNSLISTYSFEVKDALLYGVDEAILLYNIKYWVLTNKANNKNFFDGRTWTYNSASAYTKIFPFWNRVKITRLLNNLEGKGVIISGNYNKAEYDRTKWYALSQEPSDCSKMNNGLFKNEQPIPDINTDINTNSNSSTIGGFKNELTSGRNFRQQVDGISASNNTISNNTIKNNTTTSLPTSLSRGKKSSDFLPPTLEQVKKYIEEKKYNIDPEYFFNYYSADDWKDRNNKPIKNWKLKAFTWHNKNPKSSNPIVEEVKAEPTVFDDNFWSEARKKQDEYIQQMRERRLKGGTNK